MPPQVPRFLAGGGASKRARTNSDEPQGGNLFDLNGQSCAANTRHYQNNLGPTAPQSRAGMEPSRPNQSHFDPNLNPMSSSSRNQPQYQPRHDNGDARTRGPNYSSYDQSRHDGGDSRPRGNTSYGDQPRAGVAGSYRQRPASGRDEDRYLNQGPSRQRGNRQEEEEEGEEQNRRPFLTGAEKLVASLSEKCFLKFIFVYQREWMMQKNTGQHGGGLDSVAVAVAVAGIRIRARHRLGVVGNALCRLGGGRTTSTSWIGSPFPQYFFCNAAATSKSRETALGVGTARGRRRKKKWIRD